MGGRCTGQAAHTLHSRLKAHYAMRKGDCHMATKQTNFDDTAPGGGLSSFTLTSADDGRTICCEPGTELVVMLPESASTGHRWAVDAVDDEVLTVSGSRFTPPSAEAVGTGGTNAFTIRVVGTGEAALR